VKLPFLTKKKIEPTTSEESMVSRVRGEIERMEAERKNLVSRVEFATIRATLTEQYKADLHVGPDSVIMRLRNCSHRKFYDYDRSRSRSHRVPVHLDAEFFSLGRASLLPPARSLEKMATNRCGMSDSLGGAFRLPSINYAMSTYTADLVGRIAKIPHLGGLHHRYERITA
jgi:hypothetical protein